MAEDEMEGTSPEPGGEMGGGGSIGDLRELLSPAVAWTQWSPAPALRPKFLVDVAGDDRLGISGDGNEHAFGWWSRTVPIQPGATYRVRARIRLAGVDDPNLRILTAVAWRAGNRPLPDCAQDYLDSYRHEAGAVTAEATLRAPADAMAAQLLLILRLSPNGTAWWDSVTLQQVPPPPPRTVTVAVVHGPSTQPGGGDNLAGWASLLEDVPAGVDLVCLPECMNTTPGLPIAQAAEPLLGPTFQLLAREAKRLRSYVCGCFYERHDDLTFNTAVLIDRAGRYAGHYRKTHPYWPELPQGVSPGDELPVFHVDFGTLGIMTCYDSWFAETARILALKGAELIIFPNAGHEPKVLPARAIDNNVYIASASQDSPAVIIDTLGEELTSTRTRGVVAATIDLAHRPTPHPNAGGRLNSSPGGRRALRHAASDRLLRDLAGLHGRWEAPTAGEPPRQAESTPRPSEAPTTVHNDRRQAKADDHSAQRTADV
jgi:predicted amidohydrolase